MLGARRIRAVEVFFPLEDLDVLPREPDLQQGLDGSARMRRVDDGAHHAIRWIRDEVVWLLHVARHGGGHPIIHDVPAWREAEGEVIAAATTAQAQRPKPKAQSL